MDLKQYFRRMREVEASLTEDYPVIVNADTNDGGKIGAPCEVTRQIAARLITEGKAHLATPEQRAEFREQQEAAKEALEAAEVSRRLKVAIVSDQDLRAQLAGKRPGTGK